MIMKMNSKGRTELIIGGSGPKFCAQRHGNVRFCVAPQKLIKNCEKPIFKANFWQSSKFLFKASKNADSFFGRARVAGGAGTLWPRLRLMTESALQNHQKYMEKLVLVAF